MHHDIRWHDLLETNPLVICRSYMSFFRLLVRDPLCCANTVWGQNNSAPMWCAEIALAGLTPFLVSLSSPQCFAGLISSVHCVTSQERSLMVKATSKEQSSDKCNDFKCIVFCGWKVRNNVSTLLGDASIAPWSRCSSSQALRTDRWTL
jgi:hypothetical protein